MTPPERLSAEMGHVLFLDIAGFSLFSMEEQARLTQELRGVVRGTPEFVRGLGRRELIGLDTGDGMALVFFRDPLGPVQCAAEVARALSGHPRLRLRMGVHSGPVSRVADLNGQENVTGSGINTAQRVMDCGDPGHILLSSASADMVREFEAWAGSLHDMGEREVKHGLRLHLYNLVLDEVGNPASPTRLQSPAAVRREPVGGAVPLDSRFYLVRPTDDEFLSAVAQQDSIVLVKGARQMGKTSLLARGLQQARRAGARVALTDFQTLGGAALGSQETLLLTLAESLADQLDLDADPRENWNSARAPNTNLERFVRRDVLGALSEPLVWGLDEVDRLFPPACAFGSEIFGLFRSWHNRRALDPSGPWSRLTLAIAYATEAHLFITDLNQSPFNVGTRLTLSDFTETQVADLNERHGSPLPAPPDVARFHALTGGQPFLVRQGLDGIVRRGLSIEDFEAEADRDEGLYGDHLRRMLITLSEDAGLTGVVRDLLAGRPCPTPESFYRLRSAGILSGGSVADARFSSRLYQTYLGHHLQ